LTEDKIAKLAGNAIKDHGMIGEGDTILAGFSGGKDSYALLALLRRFQKRAPVRFSIKAALVDPGFGADYSKALRYLQSEGIPVRLEKTKIADVLERKMPERGDGDCCFLCSRLRRGVLYRVAREEGCSTLALGHSADDAIETFLMNMFYSSKLGTLEPAYMSEKQVKVIRPLIYVPEKLIIEFVREQKFPIIKQKCRLEDSRRKDVKKLIAKVAENRYFYSSMRNAMKGCRNE